MRCSDATGFPVYSFPVGSALSPRSTDEGLCYWMRQIEALSPHPGIITPTSADPVIDSLYTGIFELLLRGGDLPGFTIVHLFDKGFLYVSPHKWINPGVIYLIKENTIQQ